MKHKSCLYEIESHRAALSDKEQRVADFILADPGQAVNPSLEELAERIGVSDSTLFRFVRKLGFDGYQQFRIALATETMEPKRTVYETTEDVDDANSVIAVVFRANITALQNTMKHLDREVLEKAAQLLVAARRIHLLGIGGSNIVAQDAFHRLLRCGLSCTAPVDFHLQIMQASQAEPGDTALLFSHSGSNKDALALAEGVKLSGASLIVVTSHGRSPLTKMADAVLVSGSAGSGYASESFSARIAQLSIVDALYVDIMKILDNRGVESLERMRAAIAKRRI